METQINDREFSHEEGLKTIYAMIASTRGSIGNNYRYYLLWGYLVTIACILEYLFIRIMQYNQHYLVWPVLMGLGLVVSVVFALQQQRTSTHKTFIGSIMAYLWIGWLFSFLVLLLFLNLTGLYELILPVTMVMYGLGIFISGGVINFRPLIYGGIIAWVAAVVAYFQAYQVQLLFTALVVIVTYIIPGHLLKRTSLQQKS
jgi:hypothetical protein